MIEFGFIIVLFVVSAFLSVAFWDAYESIVYSILLLLCLNSGVMMYNHFSKIEKTTKTLRTTKVDNVDILEVDGVKINLNGKFKRDFPDNQVVNVSYFKEVYCNFNITYSSLEVIEVNEAIPDVR